MTTIKKAEMVNLPESQKSETVKKTENTLNSLFGKKLSQTAQEESYKLDNIRQNAIKNSISNQKGSRECENGNDKYISLFGNGAKLETVEKTNSIDVQRELVEDPKNKKKAEYSKTTDPECGITESFTFTEVDRDGAKIETKIDYCNQTPAKEPWLSARGLGENPKEVHVTETKTYGENYKVVKNLVKIDENKDGNFESIQYKAVTMDKGKDGDSDNAKILSLVETRTFVRPDEGDTETKPFERTLIESNNKTITPEGVVLKERNTKFGTMLNAETGKNEIVDNFSSTTSIAKNGSAEITRIGKFNAPGAETIEVKKDGKVVYSGKNTPETEEYYKRTTGIDLKPDGTK